MSKEIELTALQIENVRKKADETRKLFGIFGDVPIANDIFMLWKRIILFFVNIPLRHLKVRIPTLPLPALKQEMNPLCLLD